MTEATETLPAIAITMGDPAGVGPEIVVKALADREFAALARWLVVGDARVLEMAERIAGTKLEAAERVDVDTLGDLKDFRFGRLDASCGQAAVAYVRVATELCLGGKAEAMVTAPINKEAVTLSGIAFTGHTEYIAQLCGASESRMLLASERLSTVHVTTHVPLRQACDLTSERVARTIEASPSRGSRCAG
jgi:4-hydroxythreonine-4-phosphate dehydrogenase